MHLLNIFRMQSFHLMDTHQPARRIARTIGLVLALTAGVAFAEIDPEATYSGHGTTYVLDHSKGACSLPVSETSNFYAAISSKQHANSSWCGAWVEVTGPAGTAVVQIVDYNALGRGSGS